MQFTFKTDEKSHSFCTRIVEAMELLYDIPVAEGLVILNEAWQGQDKTEDSPYGWLIYHETETYWASCIGNPNPYVEGEEANRWQTRKREAERRLESFRASKTHAWLYY